MYKNEVFDVGECFHGASLKMIPDNWLDSESDDGRWLIPSIVNMAFSCELYLKSLLSDGNSEARGHDLYELFSRLPECLKSSVLNSQYFMGDNKFYDKLCENRAVFLNWRYAYESGKEKTVDIMFLEKFALVLHDLAKNDMLSRGLL